VLAALVYVWARGTSDDLELAIMVVAGVLPFWVIWMQRTLARAFLFGPVTTLVIAAIAWLAWDADESDWLMKLLAGVALVAYALYSLVVFAVAAWWRRRKQTPS
jgi:hypothetical protein